MAREPGYRSKIAVISHASGVDPVGACVGPRGSRVRMVVSELRGEKIDIIPFNEEPARFVAKALSPARVREVLVDDDGKQATVIVPDDQLSLAIGKDGLNARLAARLTGWRVDIRSETEFAEEEAEMGYDDEEVAGRCAAILANGKRCPNASLPGLALLRPARAPGAERPGGATTSCRRRRARTATRRRTSPSTSPRPMSRGRRAGGGRAGRGGAAADEPVAEEEPAAEEPVGGAAADADGAAEGSRPAPRRRSGRSAAPPVRRLPPIAAPHDLLRLVRGPDGVVMVDPDGRAEGRGAYVCREPGVRRSSRDGRTALARSFRAPVTVQPETIDLLRRWQRSAFTR